MLLFYGFGSDPGTILRVDRAARTGRGRRVRGRRSPTPRARSRSGSSTRTATDATFVDDVVNVTSSAPTASTGRRSFAAGFSAGAAFTIIYACARQRQVAAIATVAVEFQLGCTRPMPILAFHGTDDPLVPYRERGHRLLGSRRQGPRHPAQHGGLGPTGPMSGRVRTTCASGPRSSSSAGPAVARGTPSCSTRSSEAGTRGPVPIRRWRSVSRRSRSVPPPRSLSFFDHPAGDTPREIHPLGVAPVKDGGHGALRPTPSRCHLSPRRPRCSGASSRPSSPGS